MMLLLSDCSREEKKEEPGKTNLRTTAAQIRNKLHIAFGERSLRAPELLLRTPSFLLFSDFGGLTRRAFGPNEFLKGTAPCNSLQQPVSQRGTNNHHRDKLYLFITHHNKALLGRLTKQCRKAEASAYEFMQIAVYILEQLVATTVLSNVGSSLEFCGV